MANDASGGDAVAINAAVSMPVHLSRLRRPTDPRAYHVEYGYSCMGYEIPAGLGVRLAEPDPERPVVVLVGDGSYLMMNSEIVTAVGEGLDLTFVVIDNHGFQSIHGLQRSVGSPTFGVELRGRDGGARPDGSYLPVDFAAHAAAMGAHATTARNADEARAALRAARDAHGVQVVVIEVDPNKAPDFGDTGGWWDVPVAETSTQAPVTEARRAYERARERQVPFRAPSEETS
jgi:3D-(3,5/4)-trihydroxycyclohexane-1,2-dione acylhydrolase (decyclizing)